MFRIEIRNYTIKITDILGLRYSVEGEYAVNYKYDYKYKLDEDFLNRYNELVNIYNSTPRHSIIGNCREVTPNVLNNIKKGIDKNTKVGYTY